MNCLLIYYSLKGSTERIAEQIALGLKQAGVDVSTCNIRADSPPDLAGFDLIGIGTPVYYFAIPVNVLELVEEQAIPAGADVFAFMTHGSYAWNAPDQLEDAFRKKGIKVAAWFDSPGAGHFFGYTKSGWLTSPHSPTADDLARAQVFGEAMAKASTESNFQKRSHAPPIMYRIEQLLTQRSLMRGIFQKIFMLDQSKCNQCGICIKGCPMENLERTSEGYPHWNRRCIMCLACEANCPREAIRSPVSWPIMKPFIRYNLKKILQDTELEKIPVHHHHGRLDKTE